MKAHAHKVAVLDMYRGAPNQGMRNIRQLLERLHLSYSVFDVRQKAEVPDIHDFSIFISTGGPGSPFDGDGEIWERRYFKLIDQIYEFNLKHSLYKKHLFAICHSFQMLCRHFGLGEVNKRKSTSFGVLPVHKTDLGLNEPFFKGLDPVFYIVDSRDYQVVQPHEAAFTMYGSKLLALEKERPHVALERAMMAIRFTDEIFMTQFHPEADPFGMMEYFAQAERRNAVILEHGEAKYNDMLLHLNDPDKILLTQHTILPAFIKNAVTQLQFELS